MKVVDRSPNYKRIYSIARGFFKKSKYFSRGPMDETYYTMRVFETAKNIMNKLRSGCKHQEVLVAALLNNIGKTKLNMKKVFGKKGKPSKKSDKEWSKRGKLSVKLSKGLLKKLGHSKGFVKRVNFLITNLNKRGPLKGNPLELLVLQDAEILSSKGISGFIKYFLWGGKHNKPIINQVLQMRANNPKSDLSLLNLEASRSIAQRKLSEEKNLQNRMIENINSDLLS